MNFFKWSTYLIYAFGNPKTKLVTSSCEATRPVSEVGEELNFLRELILHSSGAVISGTLFGNALKTDGIKILLKPVSGKGHILHAKTDSEGKYEIAGVRSGHYILELVLPRKIRMADGTIIGVDTTGVGCITRNIVLERAK